MAGMMMRFAISLDCRHRRSSLRRARLRYIGILIHCGAYAEWGLLSQDHEWICLIQDDLVMDVESAMQIV